MIRIINNNDNGSSDNDLCDLCGCGTCDECAGPACDDGGNDWMVEEASFDAIEAARSASALIAARAEELLTSDKWARATATMRMGAHVRAIRSAVDANPACQEALALYNNALTATWHLRRVEELSEDSLDAAMTPDALRGICWHISEALRLCAG